MYVRHTATQEALAMINTKGDSKNSNYIVQKVSLNVNDGTSVKK